MEFKSFMEALKGKQHKLDKNKNNKLDAQDFEILRKEEAELEEANVEEMQEQFKVGDFVKDHTGKIHRVFGVNGTNLETGIHYGKNKYGGTNNLHTSKAKKVPRPQDVKEESEDRMARSDYKESPSGRKTHKEIVFNSGEEDEKEKKDKINEKAPPGFEGTVKAMKKHKDIDNPYALAWYMKNKGMKSHKKADGTMKEETIEEKKVPEPTGGLKDACWKGYTAVGMKMKNGKKVPNCVPTNEEVEDLEERNKQNALMRKTMDASRGARYKLNNPVPPADPKHKTARDHNVAIGRALRNEDAEQVEEGYYQKPASAYRRKGDEIGGGSSKNDVPFDGPYTKASGSVKDKSGAVHSPMSRAKHLAKMAMKKQMKEDIDRLFEAKEKTEYDYEGDMARGQLQSIANNAQRVHDMLKDNDNLPEWVQSKITLAEDYISTVANYMMSEIDEQAPVAPVPGMKFKNHAVMVHPENKSRVVINRKNIDNYTSDGYKEVRPGQKLKENEEVKFSYQEFAMMLEYESKDGRYTHKGTYGGSYVDPEGADDADDKKPKQQPAAKRGRGRPAGAKSGARKITGTSKLYK